MGEIVDWFLTAGSLKCIIDLTRDEIICLRYRAGECLSDLVREFCISPQRVFQIVTQGKNEENSV
jgi:hypothetical protein